MTYQEFMNTLEENNVTIKDIALALGYNKASFANNWSKTKPIPPKVALAFNMYIKLRSLEKKNLIEDIHDHSLLSPKAFKIAKEKCKTHNLTLENYLSSLVLSHI